MNYLSIISKIIDLAPRVFKFIKPYLTKKDKAENPLTYKDVENIQTQIKSATEKRVDRFRGR